MWLACIAGMRPRDFSSYRHTAGKSEEEQALVHEKSSTIASFEANNFNSNLETRLC